MTKGLALLTVCGVAFLLLLFPFALEGQIVGDTNYSSQVGSGARAWGMGGAFISIADDATAASWNPAGLGQLEKPALSFVVRYQDYHNTIPGGEKFNDYLRYFQTRGATDLNGTAANVDFISFTFPLRFGSVKLVPQVSFQRVMSFRRNTGTNLTRFSFAPVATANGIILPEGDLSRTEKVSGGLDVIALSLGSRVTRHLMVGVSMNIWFNGFEGLYNNYYDTGFTLSGSNVPFARYLLSDSFRSEGKIKGVNVNLGVLLALSEKLRIGAVYRTATRADLDYEMQLQVDGVPGFVQPLTVDASGTGTMKWPHSWGAGISYRLLEPLTIAVEYNAMKWSRGIMEDIPGILTPGPIDYYFPSLAPVDPELREVEDEQQDTAQWRIGAEYVVIGKKILVPLRLGFFTDTQYFSNSSGKKVTYSGLTAGIGIKWGNLMLDLALIHEWGNYLKTNQYFYDTRSSDLRVFVSTIYSF